MPLPVAVQTLKNQVDGDAGRVQTGLVRHGAVVLVECLAEQADGCQFVHQSLNERMGKLGLLRKLVYVEGRLRLLEPAANVGHDEQTQCIVVQAREVLAVLGKQVLVASLESVAHLRAGQADVPGELQPKHEERQGCKRAVDGVVTGNHQLVMDVEVLQQLEQTAGKKARYDNRTPADVGVGHQFVKGHKTEAGQKHRSVLDDELHGAGYDPVGCQLVHNCQHEDTEAGGDHDEQGKYHEDGDVVQNLPRDVARGAHVPDGVERRLDVGGKHNHGVEQQEQAHTQEHATVGVLEVMVDEVEDVLREVVVGLKVFPDAFLDNGTEAKASGYGKDDAQHGNRGEDAAVGKCGGIAGEVVLNEALDGDDQAAQDPEPASCCRLHVSVVLAPEVLLEELP